MFRREDTVFLSECRVVCIMWLCDQRASKLWGCNPVCVVGGEVEEL